MSAYTPVFKNTAALAVAKLIEKGASIALSFLIARQLGAAALGIYAASIVFLGLLAVAAEMGATSFLVREIARDRRRTGEYLVHFGVITLVFALTVVGLSWLAIPHLGYSAELTASIYIVSIATIAVAMKAIQEAAFLAHQRVEFITYVALFSSLANVGISLVLLQEGYGVVALVTVYSATQLGSVLCYAFLLNRRIATLKWSFRVPLAVDLVRRVRAFAGSSLLGALLARPEVLMLSLLQDEAQIGFYSAALQIVVLWQVIPETYMRNLYPVLSQSHQETGPGSTNQPLIDQSVKYLLAVSLPLASGIVVAARPIVNLLYGPGFEASIPLVRIMALCIPLAFLFELLWRLLAARDQQGLMLRAQVFMAAARLSVGYVLIAWLASVGAAASTVLMMLLHNSLLVLYARRQEPRIGLLRHAGRLSLAAIAMGVLAAALVGRSRLWVVVLAAAVFYAGLIVLLRVVSLNEFATLRKTGQVTTAG